MAKKAADVLADENASKLEKSLAGSVLAQTATTTNKPKHKAKSKSHQNSAPGLYSLGRYFFCMGQQKTLSPSSPPKFPTPHHAISFTQIFSQKPYSLFARDMLNYQ